MSRAGVGAQACSRSLGVIVFDTGVGSFSLTWRSREEPTSVFVYTGAVTRPVVAPPRTGLLSLRRPRSYQHGCDGRARPATHWSTMNYPVWAQMDRDATICRAS
jgi:hypothetical protein